MVKKSGFIGVPMEPDAVEEFASAALSMRLTQAEVVRRLVDEFMTRYREDPEAAAMSLVVVEVAA